MLTHGYRDTGGPDGQDKRGCGDAWSHEERGGKEGRAEPGDRPWSSRTCNGQETGDGGEHERLDGKRRLRDKRMPESGGNPQGVAARGEAQIGRAGPVEGNRSTANPGNESGSQHPGCDLDTAA